MSSMPECGVPMSKELNLDNYEEVAFETLKHRAKRLVRLIEIGAPGRVIGAEIELVRSAGIGLYRTEYFAMAAIRQASMEQQMLGFCPMCDGEPKRPRP